MRIRISFVLLILCLIGVFSGCNSLNPTTSFPTGINGVAIQEISGGNIFPPPPPTHSPLAGAIIIVEPAGGGQEIARGIADEKGGFRVQVAPGTYTIVGQVPPGHPFVLAPEQQTVVVTSDQLSQIVVTYPTIIHA